MAQSSKKGAGAGAGRGKKAGGGGGKVLDDKSEDVLQAVILADTFQDRFMPFTIEKPRCLLPLANAPLLEYTLEYLAMNGVQEVFVYCSAHAEQIEGYLAASARWASGSRTNPFASLELVRVAQATCLGDFMRDLDKRGIIEGDFVLVHGDLVATVPLDGVLARHRARREANRDAIMTMVLREASGGDSSSGEGDHHGRAHGIEPLFVLDAATGRCLEYNEMTPLERRGERRLSVDAAFLERAADIEVRADLVDCGLDICTPDVLALWTESFDCELPRKNFLHNVLKDWELNGKLIYADIVEERSDRSSSGTYAARASSLAQYDAISRDVLGGWTAPLVPAANLVAGHSYHTAAGGVTAERGVHVDATARVSTAVLGLHTSVGAGSVVTGSTLGRRCRIGRNVRIHGCYLWDDVVVGDNTVLTRSILASGVSVGRGCVLPAGSLLSFGVAVGDEVKRTGSPLVLSRVKQDGAQAGDNPAVVGAGGKGVAYEYRAYDEDEGDDGDADSDATTDPETLQRSLIYSTAHLNLSTSSVSSFGSGDGDHGHSDDEDAVADDEDGRGSRYLSAEGGRASRSRLPSFASLDYGLARGGRSGSGGTSVDQDNDGMGHTSGSTFHTDAVNGLLDALRDSSSSDFESARLEFMSLRLAMDASDGAVRLAVAAAFARRAAELAAESAAAADGGGGGNAASAAERAVKSQRGAARFVADVGLGGGGAPGEQVELVLALQRTLVGLRIREAEAKTASTASTGSAGPAPGTLLAALLQQLYDSDVLEEEGILAWWNDKRAAAGGSGSGDCSMAAARERCRVLVEWLETAEEDSESGSESE